MIKPALRNDMPRWRLQVIFTLMLKGARGVYPAGEEASIAKVLARRDCHFKHMRRKS